MLLSMIHGIRVGLATSGAGKPSRSKAFSSARQSKCYQNKRRRQRQRTAKGVTPSTGCDKNINFLTKI